jgi:hypothetical protein
MSLLYQSLDNLGMTMTLIHGTVGTQKIVVFNSIHIPYFGAAAFGQYDGEGMVVVCTVLVFEVDVGLGEGGDGFACRGGEGAALLEGETAGCLEGGTERHD